MMKLNGFLLLTMLTILASACSPMGTTSQSDLPSIPTLSPSDTPMPVATSTSTSQPIVIVSTSVQSSGSSIIGNLSSTATPDNNTTTIGIPQAGITLPDNGKTFMVHTGDRFLLNLGMEIYTWTINIDHQDILGRVPNITVIKGAQGIYEALKPGQVTLTAGGDPSCRSAKPACMIPSLLFKVTIIVQ